MHALKNGLLKKQKDKENKSSINLIGTSLTNLKRTLDLYITISMPKLCIYILYSDKRIYIFIYMLKTDIKQNLNL